MNTISAMNETVSLLKMNDSITKMSEQERNDLISRFYMYIAEGAFLILINFLMLVAIIRHRVLRSQYTVLCGLLFTDGLMGFATTTAGVGRNMVLWSNTQDYLVPARSCMLKPWNLLLIWTDPMMSIMLMVVSIDRLLAVCLPILYYNHSAKLGRLQLTVAHLLMFVTVLIGWCLTFPETQPLYSSICWSSDGMQDGFFIYHTWLRIVAALLSVVLYGVVVALMCIRAKRITASTRWGANLGISRFTKRQMRLNVSMGLSCLCTCGFYVFPICVELYEVVTGAEAEIFGFVTTFSLIISNLNSVSNFVVILYRHGDVRRSVLSLLTCGKISAVAPATP